MKIWIIWFTFVCKKVFFKYIFVLYRISGKWKIYQILMVDWLFVWFLNEILCAHCYTQFLVCWQWLFYKFLELFTGQIFQKCLRLLAIRNQLTISTYVMSTQFIIAEVLNLDPIFLTLMSSSYSGSS